MKKKISYMNHKNLINEGIKRFLAIWFGLELANKIMKDKKKAKALDNDLDDLNKSVTDLENRLKNIAKQYPGGKKVKPIKLQKYKLSDFF